MITYEKAEEGVHDSGTCDRDRGNCDPGGGVDPDVFGGDTQGEGKCGRADGGFAEHVSGGVPSGE